MGGCLGPALGGGSGSLHSFTVCSGFSGSQVAGWDLHGAGASPWLCFQSWGSPSPPAKPSLTLQPVLGVCWMQTPLGSESCLGVKGPLNLSMQKEVAAHSSILAGKIL